MNYFLIRPLNMHLENISNKFLYWSKLRVHHSADYIFISFGIIEHSLVALKSNTA